MTTEISVSGGQIIGNRELQEDAFLIVHPQWEGFTAKPTVMIVADGIGGRSGGQVASRLALISFAEQIPTLPSNPASPPAANNFSDGLSRALVLANLKIAEAKVRNPKLEPMGSTFVSAVAANDELWWISVGDSHLYLIRQGKLERINARHNYGAELDALAKSGKAVEQASTQERKRLTSALEGDDIPLVDCPTSPLKLEEGDVIILASDGLDAVSEGKIVFIASAAESAEACAVDLLEAVKAVAHPRQDNATVVVYRYGSRRIQRSSLGDDDGDFTTTLQLSR